MKMQLLISVVTLPCALFATASSAGLIVHDSQYSPIVRSTGIQPFPIAVDASGAIYTVTGTSPSDDLVRINTDGSTTVLNGNVGFVIGVLSDLDFGFNGDLFALAIENVVRFDEPTWGASSFSTNGGTFANGGLAYDPNSGTLCQLTEQSFGLVSLDSTGATTDVHTGILRGHSLDLEPSGTLVSVIDSTISRINPSDMSVTTLLDLNSVAPGMVSGSLSVHPTTGDIFFTSGFVVPNSDTFLYAMRPDGSDVRHLATLEQAGLLGIDVAPSGDGSGKLSVYISTPHANTEIWELRTVPEPSGVAILTIGGVALLIFTARRWRCHSIVIP